MAVRVAVFWESIMRDMWCASKRVIGHIGGRRRMVARFRGAMMMIRGRGLAARNKRMEPVVRMMGGVLMVNMTRGCAAVRMAWRRRGYSIARMTWRDRLDAEALISLAAKFLE
jgi:hypothetical protein